MGKRAETFFAWWVLVVLGLAASVPMPASGQSPPSADSPGPAPRLQITLDDQTLCVQKGNAPLFQYQYARVPYKPYVQELFSPSGVNFLRDAPSDHLHHHALMFAVAVDGVDFWQEQQNPGRQEHQAFRDARVFSREGLAWAEFTEGVDWLSPDGAALVMKEQRTIDVALLKDANITLLTWQSVLAPPQGKDKVTITGSHYFGLGMRFLQSMDNIGEFRNPTDEPGEVVRGEERLVRAPWCAYTADADGKTVTVAMFDAPDNARHPAWWFMMRTAFAYMSATMNLHREPLEIMSSAPLKLCYGVAVWDGRTDDAAIAAVYENWCKTIWKEGEPEKPK